MRKYIDCREAPNTNCSLRFSGEEEDVTKAVIDHMKNAHGEQASQEQVRRMLKNE